MRISNPNQVPANFFDSTTQAAGTPAPASAAGGSPAPAPSLPAQAMMLPSFELLTVNAALHQVPEARQDAIDAAVQALASGQLQTPQAIQQTAAAILGV